MSARGSSWTDDATINKLAWILAAVFISALVICCATITEVPAPAAPANTTEVVPAKAFGYANYVNVSSGRITVDYKYTGDWKVRAVCYPDTEECFIHGLSAPIRSYKLNHSGNHVHSLDVFTMDEGVWYDAANWFLCSSITARLPVHRVILMVAAVVACMFFFVACCMMESWKEIGYRYSKLVFFFQCVREQKNGFFASDKLVLEYSAAEQAFTARGGFGDMLYHGRPSIESPVIPPGHVVDKRTDTLVGAFIPPSGTYPIEIACKEMGVTTYWLNKTTLFVRCASRGDATWLKIV